MNCFAMPLFGSKLVTRNQKDFFGKGLQIFLHANEYFYNLAF
jgi:hypothetical protein